MFLKAGTDVGVIWSKVVDETRELKGNHRTWTRDHYPFTCLDPDTNKDRRGDRQMRYPLCYPGPLQSYCGKTRMGTQTTEVITIA